MSNREYLRSKMAGSQKIFNTQKPCDISSYIDKKRHASSGVSPVDGIYGSTKTSADLIDRKGTIHASQSFRKNTGRPQDASMYTAYRGSQGIRNDESFFRGRINNPSQCIVIPPTIPGKNASSVTKDIVVCRDIQQGHSAPGEKIGPSMFVDNTISLNGYDRCAVLPVNHNVKSVPGRIVHPAPGFKMSAQVLPIGSPIPNPPPKQGGASEPYPDLPAHHGNPRIGNEHFLPRMPFQPAQRGARRINEPMMGAIKP